MREKAYWVCVCSDHASVMEIIAEAELEKFEQTEGNYKRLCRAPDRAQAIGVAENMLAAAAAKDPSCQNIKKTLMEIYG